MLLHLLLWTTVVLSAEPGDSPGAELRFKDAGNGIFDFDTGKYRGQLKLDGKYQGLYPLTDAATKTEWVHPPGIFSFYRVLTTNGRYGKNARDWPTQSKVTGNGAVSVHWPPAEEHPVEITGVYRWTRADTLDLDISVTPQRDMPMFELFMSSYFGKTFFAQVYTRRCGASEPSFEPIEKKTKTPDRYVMYPRDDEAVEMIRDGRWKIGSNPVDWAVEPYLAAPLVLRRDTEKGLVAIMMCPPDDCFAVASPWNPPTPDAGGYRSLYLCLFGRDLKSGETAQAKCRLVFGQNIDNRQALKLYQAYLKELQN
jgi:hypothetical protein